MTFQDKLERMKKKKEEKLYICAISFFKTLTTIPTLTFLWLVFIVAFMDFQDLKEIFQIYLYFDLNFGQCCHRIGQSSNQYLQFQWWHQNSPYKKLKPWPFFVIFVQFTSQFSPLTLFKFSDLRKSWLRLVETSPGMKSGKL